MKYTQGGIKKFMEAKNMFSQFKSGDILQLSEILKVLRVDEETGKKLIKEGLEKGYIKEVLKSDCPKCNKKNHIEYFNSIEELKDKFVCVHCDFYFKNNLEVIYFKNSIKTCYKVL